jgi:hypothetical protein
MPEYIIRKHKLYVTHEGTVVMPKHQTKKVHKESSKHSILSPRAAL